MNAKNQTLVLTTRVFSSLAGLFTLPLWKFAGAALVIASIASLLLIRQTPSKEQGHPRPSRSEPQAAR
jgi:hypothetical protein